MSRNRKNSHYHYAEQYSESARRRAGRSALFMPRKAVFFAVLVLLIMGVVTATFSANNPTAEEGNGGALIVRVRNAKMAQDYVADGMDRDDAIALTGAAADYAVTGYSDLSRIFFDNTNTGYGTVYCYIGNNGYARSYTMTNTGHHNIWYLDVTGWGDRTKMYFANHNDSPNGQNFSIDTQHGWNTTGSTRTALITCSDSDGGSCFKPSGNNTSSLSRVKLRVVSGDFASNGWDDYSDLMTYSSSQWTKTYSNVAAGDYHLAVVGFYNNWSPAYRWSAKGTGTNVTLSDANDGDHNINVNVPYDSNVTITLTSSNKVNVSATYLSHSVTRTAPASGTGSLQLSSNNSTWGTSALSVTPPNNFYVKATPAAGYKIKTLTIGGTNISEAVGQTSAYTYTGTMGNSNVACSVVFEPQTFAITYNMDATPATAAAGTITNPATNGVPTNDVKQYNVAYTITSNKFTRKYGYTQVGWATSANYASTSGSAYYAFGATYSTNAALTLYPVWRLDAPTKSDDPTSAPTIITSGSMTIGSSPVDLDLDVSTKSADVTRTFGFTWSGSSGTSGATVSVGTDPTDTDTFMKFTSDTPGTYTVTVTVTDVSRTNVTNTNNLASVTTASATITVAPDMPIFTITAYNVVANDGDRDGTTAEKAYRILLGDRYYFSAQVDPTYLASHPTSSYTYTWSTDADFAAGHIVGTGPSITFNNSVVPNTSPRQYSISLITYDPSNPPATDPRNMADESHGLENVTLYLRATYYTASNDSDDVWLFYYIQPLIESFSYEPMQKIFNINDQTVTLAAEYNINDDPSYSTKLFFSDDNSAPWIEAISDSGFIHSFANAIRAYLYPPGPKYFYIEMTGYNSQHELITSVSEKIHTTVGTADSTTDRALYFRNNTNLDLKNYLVMCYYIDGNGDLCYQAAQDMAKGDTNNEGRNYRVMIPSDTQAVRFGFLAKDIDRVRYYATLYISDGTISGFSLPNYYGYSDQIAISDSVRAITANSATVSSSMQSFSCTYGPY